MSSSIESEFNPPDDLSREEVIAMARHYINYWKVESESWHNRWEFTLENNCKLYDKLEMIKDIINNPPKE